MIWRKTFPSQISMAEDVDWRSVAAGLFLGALAAGEPERTRRIGVPFMPSKPSSTNFIRLDKAGRDRTVWLG